MTPLLLESLKNSDPGVAEAIGCELKRQQSQLELIASENFVSRSVLEAQGSIMTNKYAEGYAGKRYYGGCIHVDTVETLAIERAKKLFGCEYVNVQPHSGAQANQAVFLALLNPGDTFLGMALDCGGHLTHGSKVNMSGKWFNPIAYGVQPDTGLIDMEEVERLARQHRPRLIIAGGSAYPRHIDFAGFRRIADGVGAYLMVDMAHFCGLVAGGAFPTPLPHAHVVTTTTHKTLRGPRGGMILAQTTELEKKFNSAVFPGNQGGPLMHVIAAKAVALGEALNPEFRLYATQVIENARAMARVLHKNNIPLVSGGTDSHLVLADLRSLGINGAEACEALEQVGITSNKNSIPHDPLPPSKTSGIRFGSPACTTRGLKTAEFEQIGQIISDVFKALKTGEITSIGERVSREVVNLCRKFPLYNEL